MEDLLRSWKFHKYFYHHCSSCNRSRLQWCISIRSSQFEGSSGCHEEKCVQVEVIECEDCNVRGLRLSEVATRLAVAWLKPRESVRANEIASIVHDCISIRDNACM
jgi:hypothetical protein